MYAKLHTPDDLYWIFEKIDYCRLKIQLVIFDFSNLIFQKSSTDQHGDRIHL